MDFDEDILNDPTIANKSEVQRHRDYTKWLEKQNTPIQARLAANPEVFPGDRSGDSGEVRVNLPLVFANDDDVVAWFKQNRLTTVVFDRVVPDGRALAPRITPAEAAIDSNPTHWNDPTSAGAPVDDRRDTELT
jgi:hypothetical protein